MESPTLSSLAGEHENLVFARSMGLDVSGVPTDCWKAGDSWRAIDSLSTEEVQKLILIFVKEW